MQALRTTNRTAAASLKPGSFDCGEEFSLDHWIRVCKLVNESENSDESIEGVYCAGGDPKLDSEVESTTADEYFARNVV
jgi:hypothetical protein